MVYLKVNALSEWIIEIYLHKFTNNEQEISIPPKATKYGIKNSNFIVSKQVQVNHNNSQAVSAFKVIPQK